ncbi:MAG: c-type cytochrome [Bacteroidota bacterium]
MFKHIRIFKKIVAVSTVLLFVFITSISAQDGKALFNANCASCHKVDKDLTGPALMGVEDRWPDKALLHSWIKNSNKVLATGDAYANALFLKWNKTAMNQFPNLTDPEIDAILKYIRDFRPPVAAVAAPGETSGGDEGSSLMFGIITLILAIVALILLQVNSNLKKLTDEKENIASPEPVAFWKNKVYLLAAAIVFFVVSGFFLAQGAIHLGRSKDYQPLQPIYYSHKVHAGTNQINCLYCHGGAQAGKHANIPSVNVCMNCHMAINEYTGEKMFDENNNEINGTSQIQELYKYAGFDPKVSKVWDPSKAKPVEWVKIHSLPDHVYFNHSQHVVAGKVACQTCHGEIQKMDEVKQFADLSMGWCVNCHRETKVQFNDDKGNGNKFYSIYEKFHNDMKADTTVDAHGKTHIHKAKMDSVTVEMIGGTECQKCHY